MYAPKMADKLNLILLTSKRYILTAAPTTIIWQMPLGILTQQLSKSVSR